jgi:hypothetical protein
MTDTSIVVEGIAHPPSARNRFSIAQEESNRLRGGRHRLTPAPSVKPKIARGALLCSQGDTISGWFRYGSAIKRSFVPSEIVLPAQRPHAITLEIAYESGLK